MADKPTKHTIRLGGKSRTILPDYRVAVWEGLNTYVRDLTQLSDGQTPDSLNWLTGKYKDNISLRRGYALLGTTKNVGAGRVTGLNVGLTNDGKEIPFFTYDQKIKYYDEAILDTIEIETDTLPVKANGEDVSVLPYQNFAGSSVYFTSPNSSIYKVMAANPGDITDLKSTDQRGIAKIGQNRMYLWGRNDTYNRKYPSVLFLGVSDKSTLSQYTQTTGESLALPTGVLAFKALNAKATSFYNEFVAGLVSIGVTITGISQGNPAILTVGAHSFVVGDILVISDVVGMTQINNIPVYVTAITPTTITLSIDSTSFTAWGSGGTVTKAEVFSDDGSGNLTSNYGGTGTINYTTGAYVLNFNQSIDVNGIYAQYYTEDATSGGIADFTQDPNTKGKGKYFAQFDSSPIVGVFPFDNVDYCFHKIKTWYLSLGSDDTKAIPYPYRDLLGIPYFRGAYSTDEGILMLDISNPVKAKVKILQVAPSSTSGYISIAPFPISEALDLSQNGFSKVVMFRWGDYDIMACQGSLNGVVQENNNVTYIRNTYSEQWDILDYSISCLAEYNGTLLSGDSLSNNLFTLFSGVDDDGATINNYWYSKQYNLGIDGLKRFHRFTIQGLIQQTQNIDIYLSYDNGAFTKFITVEGNGTYVNKGNPVMVGSNTIGSQVIGGGGDVITAYPYELDIQLPSDLFEYVQVKFVANNIGYVQIDEFSFKDCRYKGRKLIPSRTVKIETITITSQPTWEQDTNQFQDEQSQWKDV